MVLERVGRTLRASTTKDATATRVVCTVADTLHAQSLGGTEDFPTLQRWFSSLFSDTTPRFNQVREIADQLLHRPTPQILLHGDLHHENVLASPDRGWLAIDPKGIVGPREFDYCNIFTNGALEQAHQNFDSRLYIVSTTAHIDPVDLLGWIAAWSALSGLWHLEDGEDMLAQFSHSITALALHRLDMRIRAGSG